MLDYKGHLQKWPRNDHLEKDTEYSFFLNRNGFNCAKLKLA